MSRADFVAAHRGQVESELVHIDRHLAEALRDVAVEKYAAFFEERPNLLHLLDRADLVVYHHDAGCQSVFSDGRAQVFEVDQAVRLQRKVSDGEPFALQGSQCVQDALVLLASSQAYELSGDDVAFAIARPIEVRQPPQSQVVRLGRATRENDFFRVSPNYVCDSFSSYFDGFFGFPAVVVRPGQQSQPRVRIAEHLGHEWQHRVEDPKVQRRGGAEVHVDRPAFELLASDVEEACSVGGVRAGRLPGLAGEPAKTRADAGDWN